MYLCVGADDPCIVGGPLILNRRIEAHNGLILGGAKYVREGDVLLNSGSEAFTINKMANENIVIKQMTKIKKLRLI